MADRSADTGAVKGASKPSFFEKKDQKTFVRLAPKQTIKSFLLLFFKKEALPSFKLLLGATLVLTTILLAIFAPVIAPYSPYAQSLSARLKPPGFPGHWLGTDTYGRDLLSRLIYGARLSILVGTSAMLLSCVLGSAGRPVRRHTRAAAPSRRSCGSRTRRWPSPTSCSPS